jgi:hypothetical protein
MTNTKIEKIDIFKVIDDTGRKHIVTIFGTYTEFVPLSGDRQWVLVSRSHKMENGNPVDVNDDGTVKDVLGSRTLTRI